MSTTTVTAVVSLRRLVGWRSAWWAVTWPGEVLDEVFEDDEESQEDEDF